MPAETWAPQPSAVTFSPSGVYAPQWDTGMLTRALRREHIGPATTVLDLGTGSGVLAILAARLGARVTAVDISRRALVTGWVNARLAGQRICFRHGDLIAAVPGRSYDLIVSNPPYVPSPAAGLPRHGRARAWDAGRDGRAFIDRICAAAPALLRPRGVLLLVHSGLCRPQATLDHLTQAGLSAAVTDRTRVPYGPVLRSRQRWLIEQGLLKAGDSLEELVVIRAHHA
ncbi:HemK2/MTQ2 family protein methyltransferase [Streptomyces sp. NPDC059378]|uniref:HemK2/MTQ2 family protein methyltransferase n=1 Tax=Streptomyces sp. NPDC059378 TaxID=3346815 RepID=UPI0036B6F87C